MPARQSRDIERHYSRKQFIAKLRRLADTLEQEGPFAIQVAGERLHVPADAVLKMLKERFSNFLKTFQY